MAAMSLAAPKQKYRDDVLAAVSALLDGRPEATPRKMFGHPGFAVGGVASQSAAAKGGRRRKA